MTDDVKDVTKLVSKECLQGCDFFFFFLVDFEKGFIFFFSCYKLVFF